MVLAPLLGFILVAIPMQVNLGWDVFHAFIYLALSVTTAGLVSSGWLLLGRSSLAVRSFAAYFTLINLFAIYGIILLIQW